MPHNESAILLASQKDPDQGWGVCPTSFPFDTNNNHNRSDPVSLSKASSIARYSVVEMQTTRLELSDNNLPSEKRSVSIMRQDGPAPAQLDAAIDSHGRDED